MYDRKQGKRRVGGWIGAIRSFSPPWALNQSGATLVEISLLITILLAIISYVFWIIISLNARTSLAISVGQALRFAATRSMPDPYEVTAVDAASVKLLDDYHKGTLLAADEARLAQLFYHGPDDSTILYDEAATKLTEFSYATTFPGAKIGDLPKSYLYALVAVHQYMRARVGNLNVRYPCDNEAGCLGCRILTPWVCQHGAGLCNSGSGITCDSSSARDCGTIPPQQHFLPGVDDPWPASLTDLPQSLIFIRCTYVANFGFFDLGRALFGSGASPGRKFVRTLSINAESDL